MGKTNRQYVYEKGKKMVKVNDFPSNCGFNFIGKNVNETVKQGSPSQVDRRRFLLTVTQFNTD